MDRKRDMDERVNAERDPEAFLAALVQVDPDNDPDDELDDRI